MASDRLSPGEHEQIGVQLKAVNLILVDLWATLFATYQAEDRVVRRATATRNELHRLRSALQERFALDWPDQFHNDAYYGRPREKA